MSPDRLEKVFSKVEVTGFCWYWRGEVNPKGYGRFRIGDRLSSKALVHRLVYEALVGVIPAGMTLDHLCRSKACVNPDHLEVVTAAENSRRTAGFRVRSETCPKGHDKTDPSNVIHSAGKRLCLPCRRERQRISEARRRADGRVKPYVLSAEQERRKREYMKEYRRRRKDA